MIQQFGGQLQVEGKEIRISGGQTFTAQESCGSRGYFFSRFLVGSRTRGAKL